MNKKGTLGLDTVKVVIISLLVIALLIIAGLVVISLLSTSAENVGVNSATAVNETVARADIIGSGATLAANSLRNGACSAPTVYYNGTAGVSIAAANFTATGCVITNATSMDTYSATDFLVTYAYTYDYAATNEILANMSSGGATFISYVPTFFILLAVVVIILIISLVIVAVTRFSGESSFGVPGGMLKGRSSFEE